MRKKIWLGIFLILTACAANQKNILVDVEPATPIDLRDLRRHCDMGDSAACALARDQHQSVAAGNLAVIQGAAPPNAAVFAALVPKSQPLSWFLFDREHGRLTKLNVVRTFTRPASKWALQRLELRNLEPGLTYELLAGDREGRLLDQRTFRPMPFDKPSLSFALLGGLGRSSGENASRLLQEAAGKDPNFLLLAGDNVNATGWKMNADSIWERYVQACNSRSLFRAAALRPVVALWNELDYGHLQGDTNSPTRDRARETFNAFFPYLADGKNVISGPGTAKALVFDSQALALLDVRSFRTADLVPIACTRKPSHPFCQGRVSPEPKRQHHIGLIQSQWLLGLLQHSESPFWLVSGDPWFGAHQPLASFEGNHPGELTELRAQLKALAFPESEEKGQLPALLFASPASVAEVASVQPLPHHPYTTMEISAPGAQTVFRGSLRDFKNPRSKTAGAESPAGYLWLESRLEAKGLSVKVSAYSLEGHRLFEQNLRAEQPQALEK